MDSESSFNQKQKRLVLHFDINKTLVLADTRLKLSKEEALNLLLSKYAWGKVEESDSSWKLCHSHFSTLKPDQEGLISYYEYVVSQYPEKTKDQEPNEEEMKKFNLQVNKKRQACFDSFCRSSSPGMKLKPEYDRLVKNTCIPTAVWEDIKQQFSKTKGDNPMSASNNSAGNAAGSLPNSSGNNYKNNSEFLFPSANKCMSFFQDGKYQILPGFFRMIMQLQKLKRDFQILFHSFADDLYDIIAEFNTFCRGEHPCFNGKNNTISARLDGQKGTKNCIIQEKNIGMMYRYSEEVQDMVLVMGTLKRVSKAKQLEDEYEKELEEDSIQLLKGSSQIYSFIDTASQDKTLVLNHDFEWWESHGKKNTYAKPLLIDQQDFDVLNIFFDDCVTEDDDCIIDVRDTLTGQAIPLKKAMNKYIVPISLIDLVRDPDYLLKQIDICEKKRDEEVERMKNGISEEEAIQAVQSPFEALLECSKAEYLRKTVLPLLYPAFQLVDKERPQDPISFIALYCLKNSHRVNIPQPTEEFIAKYKEKYQQLLKDVKLTN